MRAVAWCFQLVVSTVSTPRRQMPAPIVFLLAACLTFGTGCEEEFPNLSIGNLTFPFAPIDHWRIANFSTIDNKGLAADTADPDADGRFNLLEYALMTDPTASTSLGDPVVAVVAGRLVLTFGRVADPSLTYSVEAIDSIATGTWTVIWSSTGAENSAGPVSVEDVVLIANQSTRFLGLKVSH